MLEDSDIFTQPRKDLSHPSSGPHSSPVQQQQKVTLQRTQGGLKGSEERYSHGPPTLLQGAAALYYQGEDHNAGPSLPTPNPWTQ